MNAAINHGKMLLVRNGLPIIIALLVSMAVGSMLVLLFGQSPGHVYLTLLKSTLGNSYGLGQVLFKATPLMMTGLAVSVAYRAGLLNIGGEGQLVLGGLAIAVVGANLPSGTPAVLALTACVVAGFFAGASWAGLAGVLKAKFGAHEVITTMMLNFVAAGAVLAIGNWKVFMHETTHSEEVIAAARLSPLGIEGSAANVSFFLALLACGLVGWIILRWVVGFQWDVLGKSPSVATNTGLPTARLTVWAMLLSGGLAGLAGMGHVLGYKHYFEEGMSRGAGFMGIAVAMLARSNPWAIPPAAFGIAVLNHGGFAINGLVPRELADVLQAVVILSIAATSTIRWNISAAPKLAKENG